MKRIIFTITILAVSLQTIYAGNHPCIFATSEDRDEILEKIETQPWAGEAFARIRNSVEDLADHHAEDPQWIVSRLAMYWKDGEHYTQCYLKDQNWDRGEGNAPVPTARMPGMRTWNKYVNVPLEDRIPYNESGNMLAINRFDPSEPPVLVPYKESGHLVRDNNVEILTLAENAAVVYWITGEEKFARFAADIFNTWVVGIYYMNPILDPDKSCGSSGGWEPGGICGYYDYEQIHDDTALHAATVYDFLYDYLPTHQHPHLREIEKDTHSVAEEVFKRFIDIGMIRGSKYGNWNVNGWDMILRPILVLDEDAAYADGKGKNYYLNHLVSESTDYHDAIPDILKNYNAVTGMWPESPGYSFGTIQMLLNWAMALRKSGIDIIAMNPILQKAALAVFPWMDDAADMVVFGDTRGGAANFLTFESLLSYYASTGDEAGVIKAAAALNKGIRLNKYRREDADWAGLCCFMSEIPEVLSEENERASFSPYHRFIAMKNWEGPYKMMATLYGGTKGSHLSPNGLAVQFYGYGYALAPDAAAYESYWSPDYAYHQSATGSNTILPGYEEGEIIVEAMEPFVGPEDLVNKEALTPYINFADVSAGEKRRTVAILRTSPQSGYYVDIFRSDLNSNDYLFHNVGDTLVLTDAFGESLNSSPVERLEKKYHRGYDWFTDIRESETKNDFMASWTMPEGITSRLWMTGAKGRGIYTVSAPPTTITTGLTPGGTSTSPLKTPALIVRQDGSNAALHPFMSVYEAYKDDKPNVLSVKALKGDGQCVGIEVDTEDGIRDYIFSDTEVSTRKPAKGMTFSGDFGWIRECDGEIVCLYMGNGNCIGTKDFSIVSNGNTYASVYLMDEKWYYSASAAVTVRMAGRNLELTPGYNMELPVKISDPIETTE